MNTILSCQQLSIPFHIYLTCKSNNFITRTIKLKIKFVAYSYQRSHIVLIMLACIIKSATSQSSSYPIALKRLGGPHLKPNQHLKLFKCQELNP